MTQTCPFGKSNPFHKSLHSLILFCTYFHVSDSSPRTRVTFYFDNFTEVTNQVESVTQIVRTASHRWH